LKSGDIIQLGVDYQGRQEGLKALIRNLQGCNDQSFHQHKEKYSPAGKQSEVIDVYVG
jgi:hypothetical protein